MKTTILVILTVALLSGCAASPPHPPQVLRLERFAPSFSPDFAYLFVNLTFRNVGNHTIDGAIVTVWLESLHADTSTRDGLRGDPNHEWIDLELSPSDNGTKLPVYYSDHAQIARNISQPPYYGPFTLRSGEEENLTVAFLPYYNYMGDQGFFTADVMIDHVDNAGYNVGDRFTVGCFNKDTPIFYGHRASGLPCYYGDSAGNLLDTPTQASSPIVNFT